MPRNQTSRVELEVVHGRELGLFGHLGVHVDVAPVTLPAWAGQGPLGYKPIQFIRKLLRLFRGEDFRDMQKAVVLEKGDGSGIQHGV